MNLTVRKQKPEPRVWTVKNFYVKFENGQNHSYCQKPGEGYPWDGLVTRENIKGASGGADNAF